MDVRAQPEHSGTSGVENAPARTSWLVGGGELADRVRQKDWSNTPLGPANSWPASLRTAANLVLSMNNPAALAWGERSTLLYNDAYCDLLGARHPEALGAGFDSAWSATPRLAPPFQQALRGESSSAETALAVGDHGEEKLFAHAFTPIRDERGAVAGVLHVATPGAFNTESANRLADVSAELEAFSYSVSHDLRAPLRAIDGFSQALLSDHATKLDEEGRRYLDRVRIATQRMGQLIDHLLDLSRITRQPIACGPVDLSAIARRIIGKLAEREPQRGVEAKLADQLAVQGDARLLTVLLENALGNAWKFTSKAAAAHIELGREQREGRTVFFVRDDGVGFDMQYAGKLFSPFQRLHAVKDFPGVGVGLAAIHRIAARHGGRAWIEAAPDKGATLYFTLAEGT